MLSKQEINLFRQQLLQSKQELEQRLEYNDEYGLKRSHAHDSTGELSSYDNHPADDATELYEREKDIALFEHDQIEIEDIDHALLAISEGHYGECQVCSAEIPIERLKVLPTTTYCKEHSPSQNTSHNRPVEEEVIIPIRDAEGDAVGFDAEDSWQDVASFGNSDTPSDFFNPPASYDDMYINSEENIGFVEDYENFVGVDMEGKIITVYPNTQHEKYEEMLDEEGIMTAFGDLPRYEQDPYVDDKDRIEDIEE